MNDEESFHRDRSRVSGIEHVEQLLESFSGVRRTHKDGLVQWRFHGRLVARQLDSSDLLIRAEFDYRTTLLRDHPDTFYVPARFEKHMMVAAKLARGDGAAVEDALVAAWELQRRSE
jgi:hypothetical protein